MHRNGHYGAALVAYTPIGALTLALGFETAAVGGGVVAVGLSTLPDVDLRLPFVTHRGPTHTVYFALAVGVATGLLGAGAGALDPVLGPVEAAGLGAFGFVVGTATILSHVAADALTPMGVDPWGNGDRVSYDVCRADSELWNYVLLGIGVVAVAIGGGVGTVLAAAFGV